MKPLVQCAVAHCLEFFLFFSLCHCCFCWTVVIYVFYLSYTIWLPCYIIFIPLLFFSFSHGIYGYCHGKLVQATNMTSRKIPQTTSPNDVRNEFGVCLNANLEWHKVFAPFVWGRKMKFSKRFFWTIFHTFSHWWNVCWRRCILGRVLMYSLRPRICCLRQCPNCKQ